MALKVKVFQTDPFHPSGRVENDLEEKINSWLAENERVRIMSVQTSALPLPASEGKGAASLVCLVFFADDASGDRRAGFLRE